MKDPAGGVCKEEAEEAKEEEEEEGGRREEDRSPRGGSGGGRPLRVSLAHSRDGVLASTRLGRRTLG